MSDATMISVEAFREKAKAWLKDNLEWVGPNRVMQIRGQGHKTVEGIKEERKIQNKIFDAGFAGITYPVEYGGQGLSVEHMRAFNEEAAGYRTPEFGVLGGTTMGVCASTMMAHASPAFLKKHIPPILRGDALWVQFFSEPGAGSDLAGITTKAERDGERWILNGSKIWSSGAYYADYGMCLARTNWDVPKHRGLTWFAVKCDLEGVTIEPIKEINGDIEFCQEFFDEVELTDDDVIGEVDHGWNVSRTMLVFERGGGNHLTGGPMRSMPRSKDLAPDLVSLAKRLGRDKDPEARQLIARAHVNDWVSGQLMTHIGQRLAKGGPGGAGIAAYGKLAQGQFSAVRARIAMELGRGGALVWEPGDQKAQVTALNYLNGRVMSIAGGTNEVQRNGIGEQVLGLPREPSFDTDKPFREVQRTARNWTGNE